MTRAHLEFVAIVSLCDCRHTNNDGCLCDVVMYHNCEITWSKISLDWFAFSMLYGGVHTSDFCIDMARLQIVCVCVWGWGGGRGWGAWWTVKTGL